MLMMPMLLYRSMADHLVHFLKNHNTCQVHPHHKDNWPLPTASSAVDRYPQGGPFPPFRRVHCPLLLLELWMSDTDDLFISLSSPLDIPFRFVFTSLMTVRSFLRLFPPLPLSLYPQPFLLFLLDLVFACTRTCASNLLVSCLVCSMMDACQPLSLINPSIRPYRGCPFSTFPSFKFMCVIARAC